MPPPRGHQPPPAIRRPPGPGDTRVRAVARLATRALAADAVVVVGRDADGTLRLAAHAGPEGVTDGGRDALVEACRSAMARGPVGCDRADGAGAGIGAWVAAPVRTAAGRIIGAVAAGDARPREWTAEDRGALAEIAAVLARDLAPPGEDDRTLKVFDLAQRLAGIGTWEYDSSSDIVDCSDEVFRIFGTEPGSWLATERSVLDRIHPRDRRGMVRSVREAIAEDRPIDVEIRICRPDGEVRWVHARGVPVEGEAGCFAGAVQDVTKRRDYAERLRHLADHDPLTGLVNRRRFTEELDRALAFAARHDDRGAVLLIDLDGFKEVNDRIGHAAGDQLLASVAALLRHRLRATDVVGRIGGDEFAVLLARDDATQATAVASEVVRMLREDDASVMVGGHTVNITTSIGIATLSGGMDADAVLRDADVAMYRAKRRGGNRAQLFDESLRAERVSRRRTEEDLRAGVVRDELQVFFQPIVTLGDTRVTGCEALVRWRHPERGLLEPAEFIDVAEHSDLIFDVGRRVLWSAGEQAARWRAAGHAIDVSVNVSARQLNRSLPASVSQMLLETKLPATALTLEITETSVIENPDAVADTLEPLRDMGVRIAIDDFGRGSSSLTYLRSLPVDVIKVDRSFVAGLPANEQDRAIVAAIVSLSASMQLDVVAEGIETGAQHAQARALGCGRGQGFLYGRPAEAKDVEATAMGARRGPRSVL